MNVKAIEPTSARPTTQTPPATHPPARPARPTTAAPAAAAALATPAAKVSITSVPASVKAEDRALYLQILKSVGGNTAAALAALQAREASEARS